MPDLSSFIKGQRNISFLSELPNTYKLTVKITFPFSVVVVLWYHDNSTPDFTLLFSLKHTGIYYT